MNKRRIASVIIGLGIATTVPAAALAAAGGGTRPTGPGGGAPLPALGGTLLGQLAGAGGLYLAWRRRSSRRKSAARDPSRRGNVYSP